MMNKFIMRIVLIALLVWGLIGATDEKKKTGGKRTEMEYRVEQLEKQNAEMQNKIDELTTKIELLQARMNTLTGAAAAPGAGTTSGFGPAASVKAARPSSVPGNLEVVRLKPESEGNDSTPQVKHVFNESSLKAGPPVISKPAPPPGGPGSLTVVKSKDLLPYGTDSKSISGNAAPAPSVAGDDWALLHQQVGASLNAGGTVSDTGGGGGKVTVVKSEELFPGGSGGQPSPGAPKAAGSGADAVPPNAQAPPELKLAEENQTEVNKMYQEAFKLFQEKKYDESLKKFEQLISKYPKNSYSDNVYYLSGECYYNEQKYEKAIEVFRKVTTEYSTSTRAADAMFKIGLSQLNQNNVDEGMDTLEEVKLLYPYSEAAEQAEEKIKEVTR